MTRRLSILAFLLLFGSNAISDASPHLDGEGGCPMACCEAAHAGGTGSVLPKLCCKVDCKQPAGTRTSTGSSQLTVAARSLPPTSRLDGGRRLALYLNRAHFPNWPARIAGKSSRAFLENGVLLI
jgi:hypothetical protein